MELGHRSGGQFPGDVQLLQRGKPLFLADADVSGGVYVQGHGLDDHPEICGGRRHVRRVLYKAYQEENADPLRVAFICLFRISVRHGGILSFSGSGGAFSASADRAGAAGGG